MGGASRDRVTIDLAGIGDAVRANAAARGLTLAAFARQALVGALSEAPPTTEALEAPSPRQHGAVKLTWRMDAAAAEALVANARALGLSYGQYVGYLVSAAPLPAPATQRAADRAALQASNDHLAALARDFNTFLCLLRAGRTGQALLLRERLLSLGADVHQHLRLAADFIATSGEAP